jgi:hypothetical protein
MDEATRLAIDDLVGERGPMLIYSFCSFVASSKPVPQPIAQVVAEALMAFLKSEPTKQQFAEFASVLRLSKGRGRPKLWETGAGLEIAFCFWVDRLRGMTRAQALASACAQFHKDSRTVERIVKALPQAKQVAEAFVAIGKTDGK